MFCDINLIDFSFDLDMAHKISKQEDIKVVFVTHLLGFSAKVEKLKNIFPNALVIEDVCESHGCKAPSGIKRGAENIGGTFSFYFGHHMTTIEGGMVSTNDEEFADLMMQKRSHGLARESKHYDKFARQNPEIIKSFLFMTDGYNFRNTDFGALLGLSQLMRLNKMIKIRNKNYQNFYKLIEKYESFLYVPCLNSEISSFAFPLVCREKKHRIILSKEMEKQGIEYRPIVSGNLLKHPFLKNYVNNMNMKYANILHENGLYISNNHFVGSRELTILNDTLKKTFLKIH